MPKSWSGLKSDEDIDKDMVTDSRPKVKSSLTKGQIDSPIGLGISRKSMASFLGLWAHNNF